MQNFGLFRVFRKPSLLGFLLLVFVGFSSCIGVKTIPAEPIYAVDAEIKESVRQLAVDNLRNLYLLTEDNRVVRYDEDLIKKYQSMPKSIGDITSFDVTNPQKIVCFLKDFNRIVILDNTLSEINVIELNFYGYMDVSAVARSNDNRIWIYDNVNEQLVKIDEDGQTVYSSNRMSNFYLDGFSPDQIVEKDNYVIAIDPSVGIAIFDNLGSLIQLLNEKQVSSVQLRGGQLFFVQQGQVNVYDLKFFEKETLDVDYDGYENAFIGNSYVYVYGIMGVKRIQR